MSLVRDFHDAFGLPAPDFPTIPDSLSEFHDLARMRMRLIREEYEELREEYAALARAKSYPEAVPILRRLLKESADLRYVVDGGAISFGLDIDDAFEEVHESNMSKLGADGKPVYREDGKVLKGENYKEADMDQYVPEIINVEYTDA